MASRSSAAAHCLQDEDKDGEEVDRRSQGVREGRKGREGRERQQQCQAGGSRHAHDNGVYEKEGEEEAGGS